MVDIRKVFGTDERLEAEGVWFPIGEGARIKLARQGNPRWQELRRRKLRPFRQGFRNGALTDDAADGIMLDLLAETVILDWEGFSSGGEPLPYTVKTARELLGELRDFRDFVADASAEMDAYRGAGLEEAEKNSSGSSNGSLRGVKSATSSRS